MQTTVFGVGYIGMALLAYLSERGTDHLLGTTTSKQKVHKMKVKGLSAIIAHGSDLQGVQNALNGAQTVVIAVAPHQRGMYEKTYLETARNFTKALASNTQLKHLIYLSSTSVYGERHGEWVDEQTLLTPSSDSAKILCETETAYLKLQSDRLKVSVLRLGGIYGPGRSHKSRIERLSGRVMPGDGEAFCNWVHQEDIVRAIIHVIEHQLDGIYNVCSKDHPTKSALYNTIAQTLNLPPVTWDPSQGTTHGGNRRVSPEKICSTGFDFLHRCEGPLEWTSPLKF